jgi:hypothetical protein
VHLGRLDVGVLKLAMRSVLVRLGGIGGDARILHLLSLRPVFAAPPTPPKTPSTGP